MLKVQPRRRTEALKSKSRTRVLLLDILIQRISRDEDPLCRCQSLGRPETLEAETESGGVSVNLGSSGGW